MQSIAGINQRGKPNRRNPPAIPGRRGANLGVGTSVFCSVQPLNVLWCHVNPTAEDGTKAREDQYSPFSHKTTFPQQSKPLPILTAAGCLSSLFIGGIGAYDPWIGPPSALTPVQLSDTIRSIGHHHSLNVPTTTITQLPHTTT